MLNLIKKKLTSFVTEHNEFDIDPERIVCLEGSDGLIDGCCCLVFDRVNSFPTIVVKAARSDYGKSVYKIDFENLLLLEKKGMNKYRCLTPSPLVQWDIEDVYITLQTAIPGQLMKNIRGAEFFSPDNISHSIEMIMAWCSQLQHRFGVKSQSISGDIYEHEVLTSLKKFRNRFILSNQERIFLNTVFEKDCPLLNIELPFMVRHSDFCTANMVIQTDGIGVFDWEYPLQHQLPLLDLLFFFSSVRFPYTGLRGESTYHDSFLNVYWEKNYFNDVLVGCLRNYCETFSIDWDIVPYLFLIFLIQIANRKFENFLKTNGTEETLNLESKVADEEKREIWKTFQNPDKNVPFACIKNGVSKNIEAITKKGFPKFMVN